MGWLFATDDGKVAQLDRTLKESFARVRQDTTVLHQWIAYFHKQVSHQQQLIEEQQHDLDDAEQIMGRHAKELEQMRVELRNMPKDPAAIKRVIDAHYDFDTMLDRVKRIEEKLTHLERQKVAPHVVREVRQELPHVPTRTALQDKIVQRVTRNSKEYLKSMILGMIKKYEQISALKLREMVVEEQGLASKSSFYRFLEELEDEGAVSVISDGKEKVLTTQGAKKAVEK